MTLYIAPVPAVRFPNEYSDEFCNGVVRVYLRSGRLKEGAIQLQCAQKGDKIIRQKLVLHIVFSIDETLLWCYFFLT